MTKRQRAPRLPRRWRRRQHDQARRQEREATKILQGRGSGARAYQEIQRLLDYMRWLDGFALPPRKIVQLPDGTRRYEWVFDT